MLTVSLRPGCEGEAFRFDPGRAWRNANRADRRILQSKTHLPTTGRSRREAHAPIGLADGVQGFDAAVVDIRLIGLVAKGGLDDGAAPIAFTGWQEQALHRDPDSALQPGRWFGIVREIGPRRRRPKHVESELTQAR